MYPNDTTNDIPYGYCKCGCGELTTISPQTQRSQGYIRGEPRLFRPGHFRRVVKTYWTLEERFWKKVEKRGPDECWLWTGAVNNKGYGHIVHGKHHIYAHRASYNIHVGIIPDGLNVCHHCDNPRCVNPAHLFVGTQSDNQLDRWAKYRQDRREQS